MWLVNTQTDPQTELFPHRLLKGTLENMGRWTIYSSWPRHATPGEYRIDLPAIGGTCFDGDLCHRVFEAVQQFCESGIVLLGLRLLGLSLRGPASESREALKREASHLAAFCKKVAEPWGGRVERSGDCPAPWEERDNVPDLACMNGCTVLQVPGRQFCHLSVRCLKVFSRLKKAW